jgi:hypothetical protein
MRFRRYLSAFAAATLLAALLPEACGDDVPVAPSRPAVYRPLTQAKVKLECISSHRVFTAGQKATLTFRLKNLGAKPLLIYEWLAEEGDNLTLRYAPTAAGADGEPDDADWITVRPETVHESRRMPLELAPGNAVLVNRDLPFVRALAPATLAEPATFLLYGELNLASLPAKSPVIIITVQP